MKDGDVVVYPSKRDRMVHLGRIEGGYKYDPGGEPGYPHQVPRALHASARRRRRRARLPIGHRVADASVRRFVTDVASLLRGNLAASRRDR